MWSKRKGSRVHTDSNEVDVCGKCEDECDGHEAATPALRPRNMHEVHVQRARSSGATKHTKHMAHTSTRAQHEPPADGQGAQGCTRMQTDTDAHGCTSHWVVGDVWDVCAAGFFWGLRATGIFGMTAAIMGLLLRPAHNWAFVIAVDKWSLWWPRANERFELARSFLMGLTHFATCWAATGGEMSLFAEC